MKDDTSPATKADIRRIEQILDRIIDEHLPKLQQSTNDRFDRLEEAQRTSFEFLNNTIGEHVDNLLSKIEEFGPSVRNHELRIRRLELRVGVDS